VDLTDKIDSMQKRLYLYYKIKAFYNWTRMLSNLLRSIKDKYYNCGRRREVEERCNIYIKADQTIVYTKLQRQVYQKE